MAQTLDYNKSVTNVYPVVPTLDEDMFIISKLDDEPNDVGGLSADQLKAEFDKAGRIIRDYINTGLIPAVLASDLTEQTRAAAEAERVTNEQERVSNENKRIADETARKNAEDLRVTNENERVAAEEIRNENENLRVSNEQQRIINEAERQDLERGYVAQSKNNADAAIAAKNAAEKARDEAKEIVDGDFIPASEKGTAGGVAELDATGKVPAAQLPATMTPAAHADTHKQGGSDPLKATDIGAVSEKKAQATLESVGWYRIARFVGTAAAAQSIVMLGTSYSDNPPFGLVALVNANTYRPRITILQASATVYFTELRLVQKAGTRETYLEAYYSANSSNPVAATLYDGYVTYPVFSVEFEASTASAEDVVLTQAVRSIPSGNVLTDGDSLYDLLWQNASPKSEFAAQTVSLDLSNYGAVIVGFSKEPNEVSWHTTEFILKGARADVNVGYYASLLRRHVDLGGADVSFSDCTGYPTYNSASAGTTNNKRLVPVWIYGIKGVQ